MIADYNDVNIELAIENLDLGLSLAFYYCVTLSHLNIA